MKFQAMAPLVQERVKVLGEVPAYVDFFDAVPDLPDEFAKATKDAWAAEVLDDVTSRLRAGGLEGR